MARGNGAGVTRTITCNGPEWKIDLTRSESNKFSIPVWGQASRIERFCDGHWAEMIEGGYIRRLLERLIVLRSQMPN